MSTDKFQFLLGRIYDAALNPAEWENVLKLLSELLNAEQAYMRIINRHQNDVELTYYHNKDPAWSSAYNDYYILKDPWLNKILSSDKSIINCTHYYLGNKEYESLEFHSDFVAPQNSHFGLGGKINIDDTTTGFISFNRDRNKQGFEHEHLENLKILEPHVKRSLLINKKIQYCEIKSNILKDTLEQINIPLLLVNRFGKIVYLSTLAEQLLSKNSGVSVKNQCILISSYNDNMKLQKLIHHATNTGNGLSQQGGALKYNSFGSQSTLSIFVNPVTSDNLAMESHYGNLALILLHTNTQETTISAELLRDLYNLTPAEARLTLYLYQGYSLDEIAETISRSKNTLRSQLRSTFNKIGVSKQSELIRLIGAGPAGIIKLKV